MIVQCQDIDEFLTCLKSEKEILQNVVRINVFRKSLGNSKEPVLFEVIIQASTVVFINEESQYLLQVGVYCGEDDDTEPQNTGGSDKANELKKKMQDYVESRDWKVLPGVISI